MPDGQAFGNLLHSVSFNLGVLCKSISRLADQYELDLHQDSQTLQQENQQLVIELDYLCRLLSGGTAVELVFPPLNDVGGDEVSFDSYTTADLEPEFDPLVREPPSPTSKAPVVQATHSLGARSSDGVRCTSVRSYYGSQGADEAELHDYVGARFSIASDGKRFSMGTTSSHEGSEISGVCGPWGIRMWDIWNEAPDGREEFMHKGDKRLRRMVAQTTLNDPGDPHMVKKFQARYTCSSLIARPSSIRRLLWDMVGMGLIGYDLITIPLQCFDLPANWLFTIMAWVTLLFWTCDIPMTFFVGFHKEGVVEMRAMRIAQHYIQSWFLFDTLVVGSDWWVTMSGFLSPAGDDTAADAGERVGFMRLGKTARFLRVLRLLRLLKLHGMIADIFERIQSEFTRIMLGIINLIIFIMLINHVIACLFYGIGTLDDSWKDTWVKENNLPDETIAYRYTTSLHWSLTQFTPASMEVVPENSLERAYTVCTLLFAMVTFSSFVSSITNAMTQLRNLDSGRIQQYATLRRYLKENRVHAGLNNQIWGWLQHTTDTARHRLHEEEVSLLSLLPKSLQFELQQQIYKPHLCIHPFFDKFFDSFQPNRKMFACLIEVTLTIGQELFYAGERAARMSFVINGTMNYTMGFNPIDCIAKIRENQWVCEPVLWIEWKHCGQLTALTHCEYIAIDARLFQELMQRDLVEAWQAAVYAKLWVRYVVDHRININDVWTDWDVLEEITRKTFMAPEDFSASHRLTSLALRKSQDGNHVSMDERRRQFNNARTSLVPPDGAYLPSRFSTMSTSNRQSVAMDKSCNNRASIQSIASRISVTDGTLRAASMAARPSEARRERLVGRAHASRGVTGFSEDMQPQALAANINLRSPSVHGRVPRALPPRGAINRRAPRPFGDDSLPMPGDSEGPVAELLIQSPGRQLVTNAEDDISNRSYTTANSVPQGKQQTLPDTSTEPSKSDGVDPNTEFIARPPRDLTYPHFTGEGRSPRRFVMRIGTNNSLGSTASTAMATLREKVVKVSSLK